MEAERNIIITGSNRGIGFAMVKKFAENGCNVWACARKYNADFEKQVSDMAETNGVWIKPVYFELTDEAAIKAGITEIFKEKKPVHTLINNAGIHYEKLFQMCTIREIKEFYEVNVFALINVTQLVLKIMSRQKYGNIINISSISGLTPYSGNTLYGGTKASVNLITQSLAIEVAEFGNIRVNAIAPSRIETDMIKQISNQSLKKGIENCVMKRLAQPVEIANVAYFLSSDEASFINGQVIRVDGGDCHG